MTLPIIFFLILLVALVAIHMTQPRFEKWLISAARFFTDLPAPKPRGFRLRVGNPFKSRPLYVQLVVFLALLLGIFSSEQAWRGNNSPWIGVWVLVDTSASMGTLQAGVPRHQAGYDGLKHVLDQAATQAIQSQSNVCGRLSTFDMELRDLLQSSTYLASLDPGPARLAPRALGTDLSLLQNIILDLQKGEEPKNEQGGRCPITHLVVISDQPAPTWAVNPQEITPPDSASSGPVVNPYALKIIWLDIASAVDNVGITTLQSTRDPITGKVYEVKIELTRYGNSEQERWVEIVGPAGQPVPAFNLIGQSAEPSIKWGGDDLFQTYFRPTESGLYHIQITPEDAYPLDDRAAVQVNVSADIRVDWQLPDRSLLALLPWREDSVQPHLRVLPAGAQPSGSTPTLLVGAGYRGDEKVGYFFENHPLIRDLNFDVADLIGNAGDRRPAGFNLILEDSNGLAWIAWRKDPPAVYVSGLPEGEGNLRAFSTTVFFNAVRVLLQRGPQSPLYTLTSPRDPDPHDNHVALHEGEGNTNRSSLSIGSLDEIQPAIAPESKNPTWPLCLVFAASVFLFERLLFSWGGNQWR
jgi:hypothetical protein